MTLALYPDPPPSPQLAWLIHFSLEWLALIVGVALYRRRTRSQGGILEPRRFAVVAGAIAGAAIGNKLVFWIEMPHLWATMAGNPMAWAAGQSLVGGLLGGLLGVELGKQVAGITRSTGDDFVVPLLVAIAIGRVGCFLAGLNDGTFGLPTTLPWGVDFGDGQPRHPTQLYEIAFVAAFGGLTRRRRERWAAVPGLYFKLFLASYLVWRFGVEFLKPVPYAYPLGGSGIQWVCLLALAAYLPAVLRAWSALGHAIAFPRNTTN